MKHHENRYWNKNPQIIAYQKERWIQVKSNLDSFSDTAIILKSWIDYGLYVNENSIVTDILDRLKIPTDLSLEERITYYKLFNKKDQNYD